MIYIVANPDEWLPGGICAAPSFRPPLAAPEGLVTYCLGGSWGGQFPKTTNLLAYNVVWRRGYPGTGPWGSRAIALLGLL